MAHDVPVIDISAWSDGGGAARAAVAGAVDEAASTVGFMQVTGHGIPDAAVQGLTAAMDSYFGLDPAAKEAHRAPPHVNRGWSAPGSERLSYSLGVASPADLFEAFNIGTEAAAWPDLDLPDAQYPANRWPAEPDGFRTAVEGWFDAAGDLARTMTAIFALALGLPRGFFEPFTDHSVDALRLNHYQASDVRLEPGQLGMGPHTDFGIVTVLWADPLPGLQILTGDGAWQDVVPQPGALLINLGDLLARWTDDRWLSTMHRVLAPIDAAGKPYRRRSAAFFHDGNFDALVTSPGGRYEPITVAEHLAAKLGGSRGLSLNTAAGREAARLPGA